jgi:two-component sensor histidine kinase
MVDTMWILVISLYTFFMLGKTWGVIVFAANTIGILYFVVFLLNTNLEALGTLADGYIVGQVINFVIAAIMISFLIFQFLNVIQVAEIDFRTINKELREQNKIIVDQNKEKTIMLREIHHRVKNNLQVITSLLRLQSHEIEDENSKQKFKDSINRVISMALIHERMYRSDNLSKIDLEGYLESLANELIQSYNIEQQIRLEISCSLEEVQPKSLVSLGLIFNELISNSLKHAFNEVDAPKIQIKITTERQEEVQISYNDNGNWRPGEAKTFGLELIASMSEQLNGTYERSTLHGTTYLFRIPRENLNELN